MTDPRIRHKLVDWEIHAWRVLAQFRLTYGAYTSDGRLQSLIERLSAGQPGIQRLVAVS